MWVTLAGFPFQLPPPPPPLSLQLPSRVRVGLGLARAIEQGSARDTGYMVEAASERASVRGQIASRATLLADHGLKRCDPRSRDHV